MNQQIAKLFSWVLHPIFIPFYSLLILLYCFSSNYNSIQGRIWNTTVITLFIMTMLFPAIMILIFKRLDMVGDLDISKQKERIFPYLIFFFFYLLTYLTFKPKAVSSIVFHEDPLIATVILGATLSIAAAFFMNNFIKVSVHTMGCASLFSFCGLLSFHTQKNLFFFIILTLLCVGLVGSSRIYLKQHTPKEVYWGFACGVVGQIAAFMQFFALRY